MSLCSLLYSLLFALCSLLFRLKSPEAVTPPNGGAYILPLGSRRIFDAA